MFEVFFWCSALFPQSKHVWLISDSKLTMDADVSVDGCFFISPVMDWVYPGVPSVSWVVRYTSG